MQAPPSPAGGLGRAVRLAVLRAASSPDPKLTPWFFAAVSVGALGNGLHHPSCPQRAQCWPLASIPRFWPFHLQKHILGAEKLI